MTFWCLCGCLAYGQNTNPFNESQGGRGPLKWLVELYIYIFHVPSSFLSFSLVPLGFYLIKRFLFIIQTDPRRVRTEATPARRRQLKIFAWPAGQAASASAGLEPGLEVFRGWSFPPVALCRKKCTSPKPPIQLGVHGGAIFGGYPRGLRLRQAKTEEQKRDIRDPCF